MSTHFRVATEVSSVSENHCSSPLPWHPISGYFTFRTSVSSQGYLALFTDPPVMPTTDVTANTVYHDAFESTQVLLVEHIAKNHIRIGSPFRGTFTVHNVAFIIVHGSGKLECKYQLPDLPLELNAMTDTIQIKNSKGRIICSRGVSRLAINSAVASHLLPIGNSGHSAKTCYSPFLGPISISKSSSIAIHKPGPPSQTEFHDRTELPKTLNTHDQVLQVKNTRDNTIFSLLPSHITAMQSLAANILATTRGDTRSIEGTTGPTVGSQINDTSIAESRAQKEVSDTRSIIQWCDSVTMEASSDHHIAVSDSHGSSSIFPGQSIKHTSSKPFSS